MPDLQPTPAALAAAFSSIATTRMRDMPLCNPTLTVEVVGFRAWQQDQIGVLVTPWCMNLICLPGADTPWESSASGNTHSLNLPSGDYEFLTAYEDSIGPYLSTSLFSPMFEFADMAQAVAVAEAVLTQVFTPSEAAPPAPTPEASPDGMTAKLEKPLSRRGFLGSLLPGSRP